MTQFFSKSQLSFDDYDTGRNKSFIDWDGMIESGQWFFLPNSSRSKKAIKNDLRPETPPYLYMEGYRFTIRKATNPNTNEKGLAIKCVRYPDHHITIMSTPGMR